MPQWDVADRLGKALRVSEISVHEMADYLGVHRNTVSAWLHGRVTPGLQTIRLWALRTGVPYAWLKDGANPTGDPGGGDESRLRDLNSGPIHYLDEVRRPFERLYKRACDAMPLGKTG